MQRSAIEIHTAQAIAGELARAFDEFCVKTTVQQARAPGLDFETRGTTSEPCQDDITLYQPLVPRLPRSQGFLDQHQIAYTEIDIERTPGAAEELLRNVGKRAIPEFVIDGERVQPYRPGRGFLHAEMRERLGLS